MPLAVAAVALDLDGTMLDTAGDIAAAVDVTLATLGYPVLGQEIVRGFIGQGVTHLLRTALTHAARGSEPDPAELTRAQDQFTLDYAAGLHRTTRFYPGALEGMQSLQAMGLPLACVTNKPGRFTDPLLAAMAMTSLFAVVISGDTLPVKKPDPGQLLHAARQLDVDPGALLVVGDSMHDLRAARAAGCPVFCVRYGYTEDPAALVGLADAGLDRLDQIPALILATGKRAGFAPASGSPSDSAPVL
jgi:phosphoglycolate phosphatase